MLWEIVMKVAICDDNYNSCVFIEHTILNYAHKNNLKIEVNIYQSGLSLKNNFENDTSLIFLDIILPDVTGIEIGQFLRKYLDQNTLQIVFVSGHPDFALKLFKIRPLDFLIKPIKETDIISILDEYLSIELPNKNQYYIYNSGNAKGKIAYNQILYFSSDARKIIIHTKNGEQISMYDKLSNIAEKLPNNLFWRVHKSFIVNSHYVEIFHYDNIKLINGQLIPISKHYRKDIRQKILN